MLNDLRRGIRGHRPFVWFGCALVLAWISGRAAAQMQGPTVLTIDAAASRVLIQVGKSGAFSFAGHLHEVLAPAVSGRVEFNPSDWQHSGVSVQFDASALKVTGKGDPSGDVPKVEQVMLSPEVLDVKQYPTVSFKSRRIQATPRAGGTIDLVIDGDVTLHGQTRPLSVRATAALDAGGMTVRGEFPLKQTDFGMQPVTAAGGTIRVKDEVAVQFALRARRSQ